MKVELLKDITWHDSKRKTAKKGDIVEIDPALFEVWKKQEICQIPKRKKKVSK